MLPPVRLKPSSCSAAPPRLAERWRALGRFTEATMARFQRHGRQLRLVCQEAGLDSGLLSVIAGPSVVHYCGHWIAPMAGDGRFPAAAEPVVAAQIASEVPRDPLALPTARWQMALIFSLQRRCSLSGQSYRMWCCHSKPMSFRTNLGGRRRPRVGDTVSAVPGRCHLGQLCNRRRIPRRRRALPVRLRVGDGSRAVACALPRCPSSPARGMGRRRRAG